MSGWSLCRYSLVFCALFLAGCDGSGQPPISAASQFGAPQTTNVSSAVATRPQYNGRVTFTCTGSEQNFTVPAGVRHVTVRAYGASSRGSAGGGYVKATIPVTPGESLAVFVGGNSSGNAGGFNGGGNGGAAPHGGPGNGGAGASDLRQGGSALANRVVVAGGEGGDSGGGFHAGGAGGGLIGGSGAPPKIGGAGGSQSAGGAGGKVCGPFGCNGGKSGTLGIGGNGESINLAAVAGGGGGGGYYGGGGGATAGGSDGGGGGGGSSYTEPSARNVINQQGGSTAGLIIISW